MNKLLVSACLLGNPVRYDGQAKTQHHPGLARLIQEDRVVSFCPEVAGGLPIPRPAAEIQAADGTDVIAGRGRVETRNGDDVTDFFLSGARQAAALCRQHEIRVAVLTEASPSCGSSRIYDGSFSRTAVSGSGVATAMLRQAGVTVFSHERIETAIEMLESLDDWPAGGSMAD